MAIKIQTAFLILFFPLILLSDNQDIKFAHLTVDDGLSNNFITDIAPDSSGFMWFATEDGLNKYDGYTFTVYRHNPANPKSLSENNLWVLQVDKTGILWIGTRSGGLNAFNPQTEEFIRYNLDPDNPQGISKEEIYDIYQDKTGRLWISVFGKGLYRFNAGTNSFTCYAHDPDDRNTISSHSALVISSTMDNDKEILWVGSWGGGLNKFDPENNLWTHYWHNPNNRNSLSSNNINYVHSDNSGILWIGTSDSGLDKLDTKKGGFTNYRYNPDNPNSLQSKNIADIWEKDGLLWLTSVEGFSRFNIKKEEFTSYFHNPADPTSIRQTSVWKIFESKCGLLWIGGWSGLDIIDFEQKPFVSYQRQAGNPNSLSDNFVCAILETRQDDSAILWTGTKEGGLNKIDRRTGQYTHYMYDPADPHSLSNNFVFSIAQSSYKGKKELWMGTMYGLNRFDPQSGKFTRYHYDPADTTSLIEDIVHKVYAGKDGSIWIGTRNRGLCRFDPETDKFRNYHLWGETWVIHEDSSGLLWLGSIDYGLIKLDPATNEITHYRHNPQDLNSISSNTTRSVHESFFNGEHILWIGTNAGLNRFDYKTEKFRHYTRKNGLPSDEINGILEDEKGNLWLGTGHGLARLDPVSGTIRNYDKDDGLPGNQFIRGGYFQAENGEMFFASTDGFTSFFPEQIKDNAHIPEIVLTDFQIFNTSVPVKKGSPAGDQDYFLPQHISALNQIELTYEQNIFSFEFAALDYRKPQKNRYAYMMEGVDLQWVYTDASRRFATYTNLDPGEYIFRVKGSNNDVIWNEAGTSIKIIITPPWWKTHLAYIFYFIFFISSIVVTWRLQLRRIHLKQQMQMEHFEAEKLREVDSLKSRFFANISHEFRTPLTLILGPVKQMLDGKFAGSVKEQYRTIIRNGERLLQLINQILDLSKLESGEMKLEASETDIVKYIKGMVLSFSPLAETKKVILKFSSSENSIIGYVDQDKLEKILTNLLSNAFKFTPEGGEVEVNLTPLPLASPLMNKGGIKGGSEGYIQISIFNTGPGIPPDQLDKIFDRFYQADTTYKKDGEGSGIGLALTKELVEVHHGKIKVESEVNKGTTFTVWLPIQKEHFKPEEIVEEMETGVWSPETEYRKPPVRLAPPDGETGKEMPQKEVIEDLSLSRIQDPRQKTSPSSRHVEMKSSMISSASSIERQVCRLPGILIVEDNPDVTSYISSFMENDYRILTAENGKEGLKKTIDKYPDLVISDVMMPEMDGFELCKKIKTDERISHIPIILLTAKADLDSKIEGLEFGCDDYISKPFEARELQIRVKNLIEQRKKLREKFSALIDLNPADIAASSMDEQLLQRLLAVFEEHMEEPEFSIEQLAREIGMSRIHLNRKIQAITNLSTSDFIRTLRLQRAARMLRKASGTVSEIAYKVGFNNLSYFSRAFRKQFGKLPSDFSEE